MTLPSLEPATPCFLLWILQMQVMDGDRGNRQFRALYHEVIDRTLSVTLCIGADL